jgi:hypothetical protein
VLLGGCVFPAQDTDFVLGHFGTTVGSARSAYRDLSALPLHAMTGST